MQRPPLLRVAMRISTWETAFPFTDRLGGEQRKANWEATSPIAGAAAPVRARRPGRDPG